MMTFFFDDDQGGGGPEPLSSIHNKWTAPLIREQVSVHVQRMVVCIFSNTRLDVQTDLIVYNGRWQDAIKEIF